MSTNKDNSEEKAIEKRDPTVAERFVAKVRNEFAGAVGHGAEFSDHEKQLASNLYMKIDSQLKTLEADRQKRNQSKPPITWNNLNMQDLAQDAVHRVRLGLDALIDNHIHPLPYLNGKTGKYDLDLQIGYAGLDYYKRQMSEDDIVDITYELVHKNDDFTVIKKDMDNEKDHYKFKPSDDPFNRGEVVGGFGYIQYEDEVKNEIITIGKAEFDKAKKAAPTSKVWNEWPEKMMYKTLVRRVTKEIRIDPKKVNPSYHYVEAQDNMYRDNNEVKIEQPEQRQEIDLDMGNGQIEHSEEPDQPQPEGQVPGPQQEQGPDEREALKAKVNELGKQYHGKDWFRESKTYAYNLNEDADGIHQLDTAGLGELKNQLEYKLEKQNAKAGV